MNKKLLPFLREGGFIAREGKKAGRVIAGHISNSPISPPKAEAKFPPLYLKRELFFKTISGTAEIKKSILHF